jgi:hypothetical protein
VKPNGDKAKDKFDPIMCLEQLRYAGVFQAVTIRQQGYPFRWTHEVFFKRYRACGEAGAVFRRHVAMTSSYADMCQKVRALTPLSCRVLLTFCPRVWLSLWSTPCCLTLLLSCGV